MKTKYLFLALVLLNTLGFSQAYYSDFEDGSLQNWTNIDGSTNAMSVQGSPGSLFLEKICDGSNSPIGEMAIINRLNFNGDLSCNDPSGIDCWAGIDVELRNNNAFDIQLRFGFQNSNGSTVVSDPPIVIPANSDWETIYFWDDSELFVVDGTETVEDVLSDVQEIRILHNQNLAYEGEPVIGSFDINGIYAIFLLSTNDELSEQTAIYPNPLSDVLNIRLPAGVAATASLVNVLGQTVLEARLDSNITTLNIGDLANGVYFVTIKAKTAAFTKKVVKR